MNLENILGIVTAFAAIAGVTKIVYEITVGSKLRLREEYRFAKEFLGDRNKNNEIHQYAIEKGYQAIAGTDSIDVRQIEYVLALENPDRCLKDYVLSRRYLEYVDVNGSLMFEFKNGVYKSDKSRQWIKLCYFLAYCVALFTALIPLVFVNLILESKPLLQLTILMTPTLAYFSVISLRKAIKIDRGEKLVKNQTKHEKHIMVNG